MLNEDAKERSSRDNARTFRYPIRNICPRGPVRAVGTKVRRFDLTVLIQRNNEVKSRAIQRGELVIINKLQCGVLNMWLWGHSWSETGEGKINILSKNGK